MLVGFPKMIQTVPRSCQLSKKSRRLYTAGLIDIQHMRLKRPLWRSHTLLSDAKMASFDVVFTPSTWKSLFSGPNCIVSDWTSNMGTIGTTPLGGGSSLLIRTVVLLGGWPRGDGDLTLWKLTPLISFRNHCLFAKSFYQIISGHDGSLRYSAN